MKLPVYAFPDIYLSTWQYDINYWTQDDDGDAGDDDNHGDEIFFGILLKLLKVFFGWGNDS